MTRASYVLDASALLKALTTETESAAFRQWLRAAGTQRASLLAPHLLRYEVGQFLCRQPGLTAQHREEAQAMALRGVAFADADRVHAHAPPLTFYDASYLALAIATKSSLVTYDQGLARAARKANVAVVAPG